MPSCNLCGRTQNAKSKENKITFHRCPKCPDIHEKWIEFSRRYDEHRSIIVNEKSVVCSAHFAADSFNVYIKNTMLKSTAIPSLIIQRVRFAKLDYPEKTTNLHSEEKQKVDDMEDIGCSSSITSNFPKLLEPEIDGVELKNISNNKLPTKTNREFLKDNNLINEDTSTLLLDNFGENEHLISRLAKKNARITPTKKYCPELRRFAISLHFRSVSAYNFVRKEFNTILPHPRTLGKWYSNINCEPGFTTEALNTLALKCRNTLKPVYCALVIDEMAVRQHVERDGTNYHGYVNVGESICNETMEKAKEALVFLVVALNEAWKIPVGCFLINHINSSQKSELVSHCIDVLTKTGVTIVSLTFDGCPTNINMVKILGCGLDADNFNTSFKVDGVANTISIIPDPAHMVKLIRNAFGEKRQFIDMDGGVIDFEYINKLLILQEDEGCHLANKLKKQHVFYSRQKMKVKLATQLLSRSVSETLTFCRDKLELPAFKDSGPTIKCIKYFNDAFDILNSRSINQYGKSKAVCKKNIIEIKEFYEEFSNYIKKLKLVENKNGQITHVLILKSARKNDFLGFLICFESLNSLYNNYLMPDLIDYICFYKLSQDHIELFFGTIRSHGGHNDNPTARQFRSAYCKLLINAKIKDGSLGNCIPLDEIDILNCSSATNAIKDPVDIINESNAILYKDIILQPQTHHIKDHDYIIVSDQNITMCNYIKEVVVYISGFICHRLSSKIKCDICCNALFGDKKDFMTSLINVRDKGGLSYPSDDVILIALQTEKFMKSYSSDTKPLNKMLIVTKTLSYFCNNRVFDSIYNHNSDNGPFSNHVILLMKSIINSYFDIKTHYSCRKQNETDSMRTWYNKMTLFRGQ
ncbi:hypothetical protein QTP88_023992 [Uroleucon formosanum]